MKKLTKLTSVILCGAFAFGLCGCGANKYDGEYKATYDFSELLIDELGEFYEFDSSEEANTVDVDFYLTLEEGEFSIVLDGDSFKDSLTTFMDANLDNILLAAFGVDTMEEMESMLTLAGYDDYDSFREEMLSTIVDSCDDVDFDEYETEGEFTVNKDGTIDFETDDGDEIEAEIDDDTIIFDLEVDEATFGSDSIELVFEPYEAEDAE